jgi:hypothetical protein
MKNLWSLAGVLGSVLLAFGGIQQSSAMLPSLDDHPWTGYFVGCDSRRHEFGLTSQGKMVLRAKDSKGNALGRKAEIPITIAIEEIGPNGKSTVKKIDPGSLESEQEMTDNFEKVVVTGKVTGDASFEVILEHSRGKISLGGRILDPGTLTASALRFSFRVKIPNVYSRVKKETKKEQKDFERRIKDDRVILKWTNKKRVKVPLDEDVDASSKEINGPGIASIQVELSTYKGRKLEFAASENSMIQLANRKPAPINQGFIVNWLPDPAKDPEGKARFLIEVK